MKVSFENCVSMLSGKQGEIVYCYNRALGTVYARRYVYPLLHEQNHRMGSATANIHALKPSEGYIADLRDYIWSFNRMRVNRLHRLHTWTGLYVKLMFAMARTDASIDLRTLTREDIHTLDLPCLSVQRAVQAGLLPEVPGWEGMTREI